MPAQSGPLISESRDAVLGISLRPVSDLAVYAMLTFTVSGENSVLSLYLWELTTQCQIAEHTFNRLCEQARVDIERDFRSSKPHPQTPIELLADCSAFLSSTGVIAKILFAGGSTKSRKKPTLQHAGMRSAALRDLLQIQDLPTLRALGVRNAFEHIDERIDRLAKERHLEKFVWLHLTRAPPPLGLVLKRFNPHNLCLSYLDEELDLSACNAEIAQVREGLNAAYGRVREHKAMLALLSTRPPDCQCLNPLGGM